MPDHVNLKNQKQPRDILGPDVVSRGLVWSQMAPIWPHEMS